ncbi:NAC domain-containing protein 5 [Cardamine amara subsp. amara]|uniref:NAC domain-containing protein 5 n=1 Tax=Cardamine amara subsp. amara TaxID=228776 RepID=A0ABD1BSZ4_CARAN
MVNPVGYRFRPTDEEIVDHYLLPKNLESDTSYVDGVISTVDICSFDPWDLSSQSRIKSKDQVRYYFGRKESKYNRGGQQRRKTKSGFWKKTGVTLNITRKRGNREKIGEKRVLVFHFNGGSKSDWVMHEYHATPLSQDQRMMTYTLCKVEFKGEETEISSSSAVSEVENTHSLSLVPHANNSGGSEVTQSLIPHDDANNSGGLSTETEVSSFHSQELQNPPQSTAFHDVLEDALIVDDPNTPSDDWKTWYLDDEQLTIMCLQDDRNDHRPQKPLTGVFTDYNSDDSHSGLISATTNSIETSSACDSFGSSNRPIDLQESPNSTIKLVLTQEVSKTIGTSIDKSEKKMEISYDDALGAEIEEHKLGQESSKNKRAGFFYRIIHKFVKKFHI